MLGIRNTSFDAPEDRDNLRPVLLSTTPQRSGIGAGRSNNFVTRDAQSSEVPVALRRSRDMGRWRRITSTLASLLVILDKCSRVQRQGKHAHICVGPWHHFRESQQDFLWSSLCLPLFRQHRPRFSEDIRIYNKCDM